MDTKKCARCKIVKPINAFGRDKSSKDGLVCYCKECKNKRNRIWTKANPDKKRESTKRWYKNNLEKRRIAAAAWRKNNPEKLILINQKQGKKRLSTICGKLNNNIRSSMGRSLRGNKAGRKWEILAGYTVKQLKKHLKKYFTEGMSWENYGDWHVDHKIPISKFNFEKPEDNDFKRCWALNNLQPLWAKDNIVKRAKLTKHFQPSLIF